MFTLTFDTYYTYVLYVCVSSRGECLSRICVSTNRVSQMSDLIELVKQVDALDMDPSVE